MNIKNFKIIHYLFKSIYFNFSLLFCINIIIKDLNYGYRSYNISTSKIDWAKYELEIQIKKLIILEIFFFLKIKKG